MIALGRGEIVGVLGAAGDVLLHINNTLYK